MDKKIGTPADKQKPSFFTLLCRLWSSPNLRKKFQNWVKCYLKYWRVTWRNLGFLGLFLMSVQNFVCNGYFITWCILPLTARSLALAKNITHTHGLIILGSGVFSLEALCTYLCWIGATRPAIRLHAGECKKNFNQWPWPRPGFTLASYFMYGCGPNDNISFRYCKPYIKYEASVKPGRGHNGLIISPTLIKKSRNVHSTTHQP